MDPWTIVLALACGVLGAPEALRILLTHSGQSPLSDIAICVFVISMVAAHVLGVLLLARFVRKAPAQAGAGGGEAPRAPGTDVFAKMTLVVSVGVAFLVSMCIVAVPGVGLMDTARLVFGLAGKSPVAAAVVIGAAGSLPFIMPLLRVPAFHEAGNADGVAPATRATERLARMTRPAACLVGVGLLLFNSLVKPAGLDALGLFHGLTNAFVGLGAATTTIVGIVLLACFSHGADAARAGAVPAPATGVERFGKLRQNVFLMAFVCIALAGALSVIQYAYAPPAHKADGGNHACSA
ncbi:hypothetical protein PR202_ga17842 [Eleusine coracana subsp. coracana]|uniref:Uncharacterized protein n=1 Tax=Eleusine coracana subsp. coracana TaxID=191504 RepID=A0AAV5CRD1_ELECO|nr:hypothetical protein QOZ80_6AG0512610 [Eleusine coracana subsp. coracana]GJN00646.1 hypothetical protein PR202_ga17842 [Eleusine coracana subsp. coracana]